MKKYKPTTRTINMTVLDDSDFLSPYSEINTPVISGEVAEFLENGANVAHIKDNLELNVYSNCIDSAEMPRYEQAIRNYFSLKLNAEQRELKRNNLVSLIFAIVGVVGLAFMIICDQLLNMQAIWVECIDIFAWVFLWEAVDQFFIERRKLIFNRRRLKSLAEMPISFKPLTTEANGATKPQ